MNLEAWREKLADDPNVTGVEKAKSALFKEKGDGTNNNAYLSKTVEVKLTNGESIFGCTHDGCVHLGNSRTAVGVHHYGNEHSDIPAATKGAKVPRRYENYDSWTLGQLKAALRQADTKVAKANAARDKALEQAATVRTVTTETIAALREQLAAAEQERDDVRRAARILFPGAAA